MKIEENKNFSSVYHAAVQVKKNEFSKNKLISKDIIPDEVDT